MKAIVANRPGGVEVMEMIDLPEPVAGPGQVLIEVAAAGVNFMDIGVRRGTLGRNTEYPQIFGVEGAGRVAQIGPGVEDFVPGQRVAWTYAPGSYAERVAIAADALVAVPEQVTDHQAAALMMQGLTASHFATDFYPAQPGEIALVHAAAGGVGQLLTQIIKLRGGKVIGRVSSAAKADAARLAGADHVIVDAGSNFADEAIRLSGGEGVHVVFDGSGPTTFAGSVAALRRSGTFCWYGPVLGGAEPIDLMSLPKSIKIGFAAFFDHIHTPALLRSHAAQLFDWLKNGDIKVDIGGCYPMADAAAAHAAMENRSTTGKLLLVPGL
ncbi:NADPH2:quinone reductase [Sphingomonas trueperi]|uniref:quinone oxidoreductase family protein n=1 Tax=Sphingomonas trueperi TaxID=53317 RepID=UPI003399BEA5